MTQNITPQFTIKELYDIQSKRWSELNQQLFGISANANMSPFFIEQSLQDDCDKYWVNGTCKVKEKLLGDGDTKKGVLKDQDRMVKDSWRLRYNEISRVIALTACFIFDAEDGHKYSKSLYSTLMKVVNEDMSDQDREDMIAQGFVDISGTKFIVKEIKVAYFPLVTALGYIIKNSEYVLRIKAVPNEFLIKKVNGVVKYKGWTYKDGEFSNGKTEEENFLEVHENNWDLLSAALGDYVDVDNFAEALDKLPEYSPSSMLYFNFHWFDEIERTVLGSKFCAKPKDGKAINYISVLNQHKKYSNLTSKELYSNLVIVKNKIKALEVSRNVVYVPIQEYLGEFHFSDTNNLLDAFKTVTSGMAGRSRLLLDHAYIEDGVIKVDLNGETYNQYDLVLGNIPDYKLSTSLSCISRAPYNYLNDAKRIMFCAKLRGQAVRVSGQIEDFTHEVPARVVFADYEGFSFGDSFVISESFAKKFEREVTHKFAVPKDVATLYMPGQELEIEDLLEIEPKNRFSSWRDIKIINVYPDEIEVSARVPFGVGDKTSNLHGSKGIVSLILPDDQMPILKNDLSPEMPAGPVDIIVPGISIFRRKSTGQAFEAVTRALGIPEMPLAELDKKYGKQIREFDKKSIFTFQGQEFQAPCGINHFLRLDHDATTKQSFAYIKSNYNYNLHFGEMEILNLAARGYYNILNELDIRSLNKHTKSANKIKSLQATGILNDEIANSAELFNYMKYLGWDLDIQGVIQNDEIDSRWQSMMAILNNDEIDIFEEDGEEEVETVEE